MTYVPRDSLNPLGGGRLEGTKHFQVHTHTYTHCPVQPRPATGLPPPAPPALTRAHPLPRPRAVGPPPLRIAHPPRARRRRLRGAAPWGGGGSGGRGRRAAGLGARARGGSARPEGRLRRPEEGLGAGPRLRQSGAGRREGRAPTPAPLHTGAHAFGSAAPKSRCWRTGKGPPRLRVGVRSPARTRLLVLLVEFFNHLGRLPSAQTHRNRPRRRSRRAEETAGRPAPCSGAGWVAVPSLGEKARPPPAVAAALVPWGRGHALSSSPSRAEAGPGTRAPGLHPGPCSDRLELGAGPGPERAECDFIRLARPGR